MFVRRSRYNTLALDNENKANEISVLQSQLAKEMEKNKKHVKSIDVLYSEAKDHAKALSKKAEELKEAKKDGQRLEQLKQDIKALSFDLTEYMHPAPTKPEERALYVARISGYFTGGLSDYIKYLLSSFKAEIARFPITERETDFYRAGVNICHLLIEWGEQMTAEHYANARGDEATQDAFEHLEEKDEAVENIKSAVNE